MSPALPGISVRRLGRADLRAAAATLTLMATVFEEPHTALSDAYLERLLARPEFWLLAAFEGNAPVGGVTAHALPLTRIESTELFIYDLAVDAAHQRRGIGRLLVQTLTQQAAELGAHVAWVPADNEDEHALEFYRALGAAESPVTIFTLDASSR